MEKLFEKIKISWKSINRNRKISILSGAILLMFGVFFVSNFALATGDTTAATPATASASGNPILYAVLNVLSWIMLKLAQFCLSLVTFVLTFIIQVASYNNYLNSEAVNTGWVMIRDLTNMIFVVALLAIAFGTILGIEHYEWKHMLFKLVSAAILVNFSRIICGVLIDISQVVMITFINGVSATLGGNFIRAFNLDNIQSFKSNVSGTEINATSVWLSATASLFIAATILVCMIAFLGILVGRMVVLWVLIVLSPIAFALSVLHQTEHYAHDWWDNFGKNVITGPVLIFFLWLTLVTVGNGTVNQDVINSDPETSKALQIDVGIGKIMTGDSLINFAIAIAMLIVGIKTTQHIGGVGADLVGGAVDFGKKTAMAASGIALARSAASGAAKFAQEGVSNFVEGKKQALLAAPKAGLQVLKSKFDTQRNEWAKDLEKGSKDREELKAQLELKKITQEEYDAIIKGDEKTLREIYKNKSKSEIESTKKAAFFELEKTAEAKNWTSEQLENEKKIKEKEIMDKIEAKYVGSGYKDEKGKDKKSFLQEALEKPRDTGLRGAGRFLGSFAAKFVESGGRSAKRVKDWEAWAENEHEIMEEKYSTSSNLPGRLKLKSSVIKHQWEEIGHAKKAQKESELTGRLINTHDHEFHDNEELILKTEARAGAAQEFVKRKTEEGRLVAEKKSDLYKERAITENEMRELARQRELAVAQQRDDAFKQAHNMPGSFYLQTLAAHNKEKADLNSNLSYREMTSRADLLAKQLSGFASGKDIDKLDKKAREEMAKLSENVFGVIVSSLSNGAEYAAASIGNAAKAVGFNEELESGDFEGQMRKIYSIMLGRVVKENETGDAEAELIKLHGGREKFNLMMRGFDEAAKKAAKDGAPMYAGLVNDRNVDENGRVQYTAYRKDRTAFDPISGTTKSDAELSKGTQKYFAADVKVATLKTLDGLFSVTKVKEGPDEGKEIVDERGIENFVAAFRTVTSKGSKVNPTLSDEWSQKSPAVKKQLLDALRDRVKDEVANLVEEKLSGKGGNVSQEDDEVPDDGTNPEE